MRSLNLNVFLFAGGPGHRGTPFPLNSGGAPGSNVNRAKQRTPGRAAGSEEEESAGCWGMSDTIYWIVHINAKRPNPIIAFRTNEIGICSVEQERLYLGQGVKSGQLAVETATQTGVMPKNRRGGRVGEEHEALSCTIQQQNIISMGNFPVKLHDVYWEIKRVFKIRLSVSQNISLFGCDI